MSMLAVALVLAAQQAAPRRRRGGRSRRRTCSGSCGSATRRSPPTAPTSRSSAWPSTRRRTDTTPRSGSSPPTAPPPPRPFTSGPRDTAPRWSPDGRRLAFLRAAEKDGKPQPPQIHLMERAGGEARAITDLPKGASAPVWSPDGRTLAFTSTTNAKDLDARAKEAAPRRGGRAGERRARHHAGRLSLERQRLRRLRAAVPRLDGRRARRRRDRRRRRARSRAAPSTEDDPVWSADGARILFTSTRVAEPYYEASDEDLFAVAAEGGAPALVTSIDGSIGAAAPSPDGRRIAFRGTLNGKPLRSYTQPDLFVVDVAGGAAAEPDRGPRFRRDDRAGRRPAGAARRGSGAHRLAEGRPQPALRRRREGAGQRAAPRPGHRDGCTTSPRATRR